MKRAALKKIVQAKVDPSKWERLRRISKERDVRIAFVLDEALALYLKKNKHDTHPISTSLPDGPG